ncbi:MAG TPA: hypothetical protein DCM28_01125 [Phycisphaerales bacterium]|nr:hypothetical protein [Phycisphaerales bacterium]HCD32121.1 hypothetical protein [Phycisphaerales bacterium]|tara:strand:- start:159 stop:1043 length:885 start_codon:yes stop_codon:yes gene_type:complete
MAQSTPITNSPSTLLDYIARHAQVHTFNGSLQKHESGYEMASRIIGDYNLLFVTRGRVVWVVEDESTTLGPQSLLMVSPGLRHHAYSLTNRVTLLSIHLRVQLPGGVDVMQLLEPEPLFEVSKNSRLNHYLLGLQLDYQGKSICPRQELLPGWTNLIAHELLHVMASDGKLTSRKLDPMVCLILERIDKQLTDPLTLEQIAHWAGYTPQHTNRLFKQVLGVTPLQYLLQLRMSRAAALLAENILTVQAVGRKVGFEDPYYFSRMFKQSQGLSPQQYQQSVCSDHPSGLSGSPLG